MHPTERFERSAPQRQTLFQPDCPVYIHCTCRCTDRRSGAAFLQVRMVNRAPWTVQGLWLRITGTDPAGTVCFERTEVLTELSAGAGTVFGEKHLIPVGMQSAERLTVTVEHIMFGGGTHWQRLAEHRLCVPEELGWRRCVCGLPNPPEVTRCPLCGRLYASDDAPVTVQSDSAVTQCPPEPPTLQTEETPPFDEELPFDEEDLTDVPRWMTILLWLLTISAIAAVIGVAIYCIWLRVR